MKEKTMDWFIIMEKVINKKKLNKYKNMVDK